MAKALLLLALWMAVPVFSAHRYELVPLGSLGENGARAAAINNAGQIVGSSATPEGVSHTFLWENGVMHDLGSIGEGASQASAINEHGVAVGWVTTPEGPQAVKFENGGITPLGTDLPASYAYAINDAGRVVGAARPPGIISDIRLRPYELFPGTANLEGEAIFVDPPERRALRINNAGQILINSGASPFRAPAEVRLLASGDSFVDGTTLWFGEGKDLNEAGEAVGQGYTKFMANQAVLWRNGKLVHLPSPFGSPATASALNNFGQVAGQTVSGTSRPEDRWDITLWENGMGYSLRDLILDATGSSNCFLEVADMNDSGAILVNSSCYDPTSKHEAWLLRPLEEVTLPVAQLTLPEDEAVFDLGTPVRVEWELVGDIHSLEVLVICVGRTNPYLTPIPSLRLWLQLRMREAVPAGAASMILTNLPAGPAAIMLKGHDANGVRFVSPPRYVRSIGPGRLVPLRRTSNGGFQIGLEHTPETIYQVEWTTNLTEWHAAPSASGSTFAVPYLQEGMALARARKIANEGGGENLSDFSYRPERLEDGKLRLFPVTGSDYAFELGLDGAYTASGTLGSGTYTYQLVGRRGNLTLLPSSGPPAITFTLEFAPIVWYLINNPITGFYSIAENGQEKEIGDFSFTDIPFPPIPELQ